MTAAAYACVVTGLPASGKSTVARALSKALGWPCFDKDDFLEALYADHLPETPEERRELSRRSDLLFRNAARQEHQAVLVSHWASTRGPAGTGTATGWISDHFDKVLEVHCACSQATATARFRARERHPGHLDHLRSDTQVAAQMTALAPGFPLSLWPIIEINTETSANLTSIPARIQSILTGSEHA